MLRHARCMCWKRIRQVPRHALDRWLASVRHTVHRVFIRHVYGVGPASDVWRAISNMLAMTDLSSPLQTSGFSHGMWLPCFTTYVRHMCVKAIGPLVLVKTEVIFRPCSGPISVMFRTYWRHMYIRAIGQPVLLDVPISWHFQHEEHLSSLFFPDACLTLV